MNSFHDNVKLVRICLYSYDQIYLLFLYIIEFRKNTILKLQLAILIKKLVMNQSESMLR